MQEFVMMIGLPGSGKDYFIEHDDILKNHVIVSTDQIRKDNGYKQGTKNDVFQIAHDMIIDSLSLGKNVVFNATNLQRKFRMNLLTELRAKFPNVFYEADVIIAPVKLCKEQNSYRDEFGCVPEKVIDNMVRSFQIPLEKEGFDGIYCFYPNKKAYCIEDVAGLWIKKEYASVDFDALNSFDQDNPFHTMTLGQHMQNTYKYVVKHYNPPVPESDFWGCKPLFEAAKYHDIGKLITKDYHDRKGRPTETAHYYGHENAGAYLILSEFPFLSSYDTETYITEEVFVKMATYVNFHMRVSFTWRQYPDGKCAKREKKLFNNYDLYCLELLGEADRQAH